ncbi:Hypothetical predicted protein [Mytilus galloprovincialis]|uniref:Reverse transcriptase domain-containing protein n=1 Tax=Mytilus galloprovincialis TaxID=29158 RepID=A0A8B6CLI2_MYTGA|nr:Hypothetical predicted protein [Mytilus galloprovincialis]
MPFWTGIRKTSVSLKDSDILIQEINTLIEKDAIEPVRQQDAATGFYSTFFLVPKKNGTMRPVINLRPLNRYLKKIHFKMDTLTKVLNLVKIGDWAISLDLSDAYLHIPIFQKHRKVSQIFCSEPVLSVESSLFRTNFCSESLYKNGFRSSGFSENSKCETSSLSRRLVSSQSKQGINYIKIGKKCLDLLNSLGFLINREKNQV